LPPLPFNAGVTYISLAVRAVVYLQVDQWDDASWFLVIGGLEVIEAVVSRDEPTPPPALVLPSCA